jgi:hypothetical protein
MAGSPAPLAEPFMGSITVTKRQVRTRLSSLRLGLAALARLHRTLTHDERMLAHTLAENEDLLLSTAARRWPDWNPDTEYVGAFRPTFENLYGLGPGQNRAPAERRARPAG